MTLVLTTATVCAIVLRDMRSITQVFGITFFALVGCVALAMVLADSRSLRRFIRRIANRKEFS